ncbi:MAG: CHAT domain-containing protein [Gammaproteobacteria bacterium]|nr:CHAT domain-containing protein [Gammaproteobacteria bacterium]
MARCIVVLILSLALSPSLVRAQGTPLNPIIDQVVELLRGENNEEPNPEAIVGQLNLIVAAAYQKADYARVEAEVELTWSYAERVLGSEHPQTLESIYNLAILYWSQGRYEEAEPLHKRALAARERALGPEHPDTLASINDLANLHHSQGRYGEAERLHKRALAAREQVLGPEHPQTLESVYNLALLYISQSRFGDAEPLLERKHAVSERVLGPEHPDTAVFSVVGLAALYRSQGRFRDAELFYKRALKASKRVLRPENPHTLGIISNLAALYEEQGRYGEAEPLQKSALAARERILGSEHPSTVGNIHNLAKLYRSQGRYEEAESLFKRAVAVDERVLGPEHPDTLRGINDLAILYEVQGRYGEAETLYKGALGVCERELGAKHRLTLFIADNLARLYNLQGRLGEAELLHKRVLAMLEPDDLQILAPMNNIALLYESQGRYGEAEQLLKGALAALKQELGPEHRNTLIVTENLARLYHLQGSYDEAYLLYKHALAISERVLGPEHPQTLVSVNGIASLYESQGRYAEAEPLYKRTLAARERVLGPEHPHTLRVQMNLATVLISQGNQPAALCQLRRLDARLRAYMGLQLATTEKERVRRGLLATESTLQDVVSTLAVRHPSIDTAQLAADILLRWKRFAGKEEGVVARLARTSQDPHVVKLAQQIRSSRAALSRLVNLAEPNAETIASERAKLERLETALARLNRTFRDHVDSRGVTWETVQGALPPGAALLELREYLPVDFESGKSGDPHWLALLIPADPGEGPALRVIDLGPLAESRLALTALRMGDRVAAEAVYTSLFGDLDADLARYETLFLAPDGMLDLVAFSRLVLPDGRYWIERQAVRYVRSGRDLLTDPGIGEATDMVVFGGVDYERFAAAEQETDPIQPSEAAASKNGLSADIVLAMNLRLQAERNAFNRLKYTGSEARSVARYYADRYSRRVQLHLGVAASETQLKTLKRPPRVLHLATHGFFLEARREHTERPLTLAGLALAGANRGLEGELSPAAAQDGILYALEAQDLNLEGTALVTLSACDTGKGEVDYSEGVYGLVRAFQIAGANDVLMTLWPLNDQLAEEFITDFYQRWFDPRTSDSPAEALRATQLAWIKSGLPRRDPTYWAPYVLVERR